MSPHSADQNRPDIAIVGMSGRFPGAHNVEEFWQALNEYRGGSPLLTPVVAPVAAPHTEPPQEVALAAVGQGPVTVVTRPVKNNKRRGAFLLLFTALVLLALVGGLVLGSTHLFSPASSNHPSSTATSATGKKATATSAPRPSATTKPDATSAPATQPTTPPATAGPVSTPPPTTAPAPTGYPTLANSYSGTVNDQITNPATQGNLTLSRISQNNPNISGHADITGNLQGSGNFTGQITTGGAISFLLQSNQVSAPLFFQGQISSSGSMSGTYCSYRNNVCDSTAGGYGTWQVSSAQASSSS